MNLNGMHFTDGVDFTFPAGSSLAPGAFAVLVRNPTQFAARYPAVPIAGTYSGALDNAGELIAFRDLAQTVIADDPLELVTREDEYTVGLDELGRTRISPTDVSQFIRLDQCERHLRLRLHDRFAGARFLYDYGAVPQSIPFLLTQSGSFFEEGVERVNLRKSRPGRWTPRNS